MVKVTLIDRTSSEALFFGESPIGKTIEINGEPFTVIGEFTEASEGAKTIGLDGITRPMPAPSADEIYKI